MKDFSQLMISFIAIIFMCSLGIYAIILGLPTACLSLQIVGVVSASMMALIILNSLSLVIFACYKFFSKRKRESKQ
ncbi:hypothetical protein EFP27_12080 [Lacticaseibacillus paracasei]|nr:hypothetical protein [Lacticaseibacillus paracasei]